MTVLPGIKIRGKTVNQDKRNVNVGAFVTFILITLSRIYFKKTEDEELGKTHSSMGPGTFFKHAMPLSASFAMWFLQQNLYNYITLVSVQIMGIKG